MPEYELYNHIEDPINLDAVAAEHPEIVEALKGQLAEGLRYMEARQLPADEDAIEDLSPEELRRLRSLGYLR